MKDTALKDSLVSVIIPVYNALPYLPRCLDSVLGNTYQYLEILCIDDGSNDGSSTLLEAYAKKDPRVHITVQENKGVASARNAGLKQASGDYISFIDSDDCIHPQYFETLLKAANEYDADITACSMTYISENDRSFLRENTIGRIKINRNGCKIYKGKSAVSGKGVTGCAVMWKLYRADILRNIRFQNEIRIEDLPFCLESVCAKDNILCVSIPLKLYYYCRHSRSLSTQLTANDEFQMAVYFYDQGIDAKEKHMDRRAYAFFLHAMKRGILLRYRFMFLPKQKRICHQFVKNCLQQFLTLKDTSCYERIRYRLLVNYPLLYHVGHLLKRPSDIWWELRYLKTKELKQKSSR